MEITWTDCEPTEENFWENLKRCDKYNRFGDIVMISSRFYEFEKNIGKTPKDFELELRKRNFNFGLIATHISQDPDIKSALDKNEIRIIKPQYFYGKNKVKTEDIKDEHLSEYYIKFSCRPRDYVIKETLEFSKSLEENMEKLEISGNICSNEKKKISDNDVILNNEQIEFGKLISKGLKMINIKEINFEDVFNKYQNENPNATIGMVAMGHNGEAIMALILNGQIICPIGLSIGHDTDGNKKINYIPLN